MITIEKALGDPALLGAGLGNLATWANWCAVLKGAFGIQLSRKERRAFEVVAQRAPPTKRVGELWCILGRRSGKSRIAAALAVFFALFIPHQLAAGEVGTVLVLAASKAQANVVFRYCQGLIESSPVLRQELVSATATELRLRNGVIIGVHPASFRTVRGRTILACIFDEVAYWRDEYSASPDIEIHRAVLPSLATTGGMLIGISTPYRKAGLLHGKFRDSFGVDDPSVLVIRGDSKTFNPLLDDRIIEQATAADPEAADSEWGGNFRTDLAALLDDALIEDAIDYSRPLELPPQLGFKYKAFLDPSGGRHDSFSIAIAHRESDRLIVDVVRGRKPPFDPHQVTAEFVALAAEYG